MANNRYIYIYIYIYESRFKINVCIHNICVYAVYIYYVIHHLRKICYAYILYNINYMNINIYMQILSKYIRYVCLFKYTQCDISQG